jgi:hypothetical protein
MNESITLSGFREDLGTDSLPANCSEIFPFCINEILLYSGFQPAYQFSLVDFLSEAVELLTRGH